MRISGSNVGYTMFRGSVKDTGYPLHSPVSPSLPLSCVTVCHHISAGVYLKLKSVAVAIHTPWFLLWVTLAHDVQRQVVANTAIKFRVPYRSDI